VNSVTNNINPAPPLDEIKNIYILEYVGYEWSNYLRGGNTNSHIKGIKYMESVKDKEKD
jgi:hypothetical protein